MLGLDTGFFVLLLQGQVKARAVWASLVEGDSQAVVSCISLFELERLALRGAIGTWETLRQAIPAVCTVVWIDGEPMLRGAAKLSHSNGVPAIDALIVASLQSSGAKTIYTTDPHLSACERRGLKVELLG